MQFLTPAAFVRYDLYALDFAECNLRLYVTSGLGVALLHDAAHRGWVIHIIYKFYVFYVSAIPYLAIINVYHTVVDTMNNPEISPTTTPRSEIVLSHSQRMQIHV